MSCAAKLRKATLSRASGHLKEQESLLREANTSFNKDPLLRAQITHHLISQEKWKEASDFASQTRRANQDDVHALCALGAYHYHVARESKASEADRARDFVRSAEAYNRALEVDPKCAIAAQGLAIAIAEDNLPPRRAGANGASESQGPVVKAKSLDMALGIFTRIRDCVPDRSVLINIGHCYSFKGDEEQAIEAVSTVWVWFQGDVTEQIACSIVFGCFRNRPRARYLSPPVLGPCVLPARRQGDELPRHDQGFRSLYEGCSAQAARQGDLAQRCDDPAKVRGDCTRSRALETISPGSRTSH